MNLVKTLLKCKENIRYNITRHNIKDIVINKRFLLKFCCRKPFKNFCRLKNFKKISKKHFHFRIDVMKIFKKNKAHIKLQNFFKKIVEKYYYLYINFLLSSNLLRVIVMSIIMLSHDHYSVHYQYPSKFNSEATTFLEVLMTYCFEHIKLTLLLIS